MEAKHNTTKFNIRDIETLKNESLRVEKQLGETITVLGVFSERPMDWNDLSNDECTTVENLWNLSKNLGSKYRLSLEDSVENVRKLGPLIHLQDAMTQTITAYLATPTDEREPRVLMKDLANFSAFTTKIDQADVSAGNNVLWTELGVNPFTSLPSISPTERKTDTRVFWGLGAGGVSAALILAGVLAAFLGGPIGAAVGIPLFVLGMISGVGTAIYMGYVKWTSEPQVSPYAVEDSKSWEAGGFQPDKTLNSATEHLYELIQEFKIEKVALEAAKDSIIDPYSQQGKESQIRRFDQRFQMLEPSIENPNIGLTQINQTNADLRQIINDMKSQVELWAPDKPEEKLSQGSNVPKNK